MDTSLTIAQKIAIWALPVLLAITFHEVAHGWTARALGDHTAERMGRLSLNPLKHVDPIGTVLVPGILLLLGGFLFGWAKPVPVVMGNLRNPRRDMAIVAVAGPLSNFAMAIAWGLLLKLALPHMGGSGMWLGVNYMARAGIFINIVLMVLNLIPIPPLDGSRIVPGLLPANAARQYNRIEPYGLIILLLLMATGMLASIMSGPMMLSESVVLHLLHLV